MILRPVNSNVNPTNVRFPDEVGDFEFAIIVMRDNERKTPIDETKIDEDEDEEYTPKGPSEPKETETIQPESME